MLIQITPDVTTKLMSLTLVAPQHALFTAMSLRAYLSYPNTRHPGVPIDRYVLHLLHDIDKQFGGN